MSNSARGGSRPGAGRKKIYHEPMVSIRVPVSQVSKIRQILNSGGSDSEVSRLVSEYASRAPWHLPSGKRGAWRHACYLLQAIQQCSSLSSSASAFPTTLPTPTLPPFTR
jgi:hypothetical protein